jgi:ubiquinone biosynthesis protein UbiJ
MPTQSPFSFVEDFLRNINVPLAPPAWVVEETHRRVVLLLNHVLMQEPLAMERLVRQKGRVVLVQWRTFTFKLVLTPAGLFDLATPESTSDLTLIITEDSPFAIAQAVMQGEKPPVRVAGDVQLAAEVNWLVDHVRWDLEEDLARIVGDAPAHAMAQAMRSAAEALQQFVGKRPSAGDAGPSA